MRNIDKLKQIYSDLTNSKLTIDLTLISEIESCLEADDIKNLAYVKSLVANQAFMEMDQSDLRQQVKSAIGKYAFTKIITEYEFFNDFKSVMGFLVNKKISKTLQDRTKYQKNFKDYISRVLQSNSLSSKFILDFSIKFWDFIDNNDEINSFLKEYKDEA